MRILANLLIENKASLLLTAVVVVVHQKTSAAGPLMSFRAVVFFSARFLSLASVEVLDSNLTSLRQI